MWKWSLMRLRLLFGTSDHKACLQCGLLPRQTARIVSDDPFLHPHECPWCRSVLLVPGLMLSCPSCSKDSVTQQKTA